MTRLVLTLLAALVSAAAFVLPAQGAAEPVEDPFDMLAPFVGKTWRGELKDPRDPTKVSVDISKWEWALGGRAIRITHSLNEGAYGGETVIFYDAQAKTLIGHYFTTAGFHTLSTIEPLGENAFVSVETVSGHPTIAEVRATVTLSEDGSMATESVYVGKDGSTTPGHAATYTEVEGVEPVIPSTR